MEHEQNNHNPQPRRRVRRRRKKANPAPLIVAVLIIFLAGMLCGFLLRGALIPAEEAGQADSAESGNNDTPEDSTQDTTEDTTQDTTEDTTVQTGPVEIPWNLILVNPWNEMPEDYEIELAEIPNSRKVDVRCYDDLMDMVDAMKQEGLSPIFRSGYRTMYDQQCLFENKVNYYLGQGYSQSGAEAEAATVVAIPGTSEHQVGLAVDIVDDSYWTLDEKQESTPVQQWLMKNSWKYGFILRYPNGSTDITGIIYEPWHYRYVGKEVAKEIYELDITLEEYLELKYPQG